MGHTALTGRARALVATALIGALLLVGSSSAAADPDHWRGPDPTEASITAVTGPFVTASASVPSSVPGFGGGVVHYPTDTSEGTFGAVAVAPGFLGSSANYAWLGPRLASQGFVVLLMNTNSRLDGPPSRGDQLLAALDWLVTSSPVRTRIDAARLAVAGHSMGGGGALEAAAARPSLRAALPLQPWHTTKSWTTIQVPTMVIGAEDDTTAPVATHAEPFYVSIPAPTEKAYLELGDADHRVSTTGSTTEARFMIAWLKVYVDGDSRYEQFVCPNPGPSATIAEYRDTCPA